MFKHRVFSIFFVCIVIFSLISLACASSAAKPTATLVPQKPATSQEVATSPEVEQPDEGPSTTAEISKPHPTATTVKSEPVVIAKQGFGQDQQMLGFGYILENPNSKVAIQDSQYQIAIYDIEGTVVDTDSGYISLILPKQKLGIGGWISLDEGVTAAKVTIQINPGDPAQSDLAEMFTVDKITYVPNEYSPEVRGLITNETDKDISYLQVSALVFGDGEEIIGGGSTYLNFINAGSSIGVSVPVYCSGDVSRVEIYPALSGFYSLENVYPMPAGASNIILSKQGFGQSDTQVGYGLIFENPNQEYVVDETMYHVTAFAEDGTILAATDNYIDILLPNQTLGVGGDLYLKEGEVVARIETQIKSGNFNSSDEMPLFTSENAAFLPDEYSPQISGEIVSPYNKDIEYLRVSAIAYDEAGNIIGGGYTYLDFVPAKSRSAVSVYVTVSGIPATVELYASVTSLSDLEG